MDSFFYPCIPYRVRWVEIYIIAISLFHKTIIKDTRNVTIVTGVAAYGFMKKIAVIIEEKIEKKLGEMKSPKETEFFSKEFVQGVITGILLAVFVILI